MSVGDYRVRLGATTDNIRVAALVRHEHSGEHDVIRGYGQGDAMALRDLYGRIKRLLKLVEEAGKLAIQLEGGGNGAEKK